MKITSLVRNKHGNRISVYLDDSYGFSVEEDTLIQEGLYKDKVLSESETDRIIETDRVNKYFAKTLNLVSRRPRSEYEIARYLQEKLRSDELSKQLINEISASVIAKLVEKEYLNDSGFAEWWIKNRTEFKIRSKQELRQELRIKGIESQLIEQKLEQFFSDDDEIAAIKEVIIKKAAHYKRKSKTDSEYRQKLTEYLLRKGFSWNNIKKSLNNF